MKTVVVYVYAVAGGSRYDDYALRFLESYHAFPPGAEHETIIVLNGIKATSETACLFSSLPQCRFLEHDNSGWDLGAFQHAARKVACDLIVFFGASTYFKRAGWLKRMVAAYNTHGNALYGAMGNRGDAIPAVNVHPHIRTTAFWLSPQLFNQYPMTVTQPEHRYQFEHGKDCLTAWASRSGLKSFVVSWDGEYEWDMWDAFPNGYHRGDQSQLLALDRVCEPPFYPVK